MAYHTFTSVLLLCSILLITECWSLKVEVTIPKVVTRGDRAVLRCIYDLEGDPVYSVRWYKGRRGVFYSYIPSESPREWQIPIRGLEVLQNEWNETTVVLNNVSMVHRGRYICEISVDAPSFWTVTESGMFRVVEVSKHRTVINGLEDRYRLGDVLKPECNSFGPRPAANIQWELNGVLVERKMITNHSRPSENGTLINSHSVLPLQITPQLCRMGRMNIRCIASIHDVYITSSEMSVELEGPCRNVSTTPPPTTNREGALPADSHPRRTVTCTAFNNGGVAGSFALWTLMALAMLPRWTR